MTQAKIMKELEEGLNFGQHLTVTFGVPDTFYSSRIWCILRHKNRRLQSENKEMIIMSPEYAVQRKRNDDSVLLHPE